MDFMTAISTGATVKYTTEEFACSFMEAVAQNPHNWLAKVSHHFVGQCFRVLGLNFTVSLEEFERSVDHPYRDDNLTYIFNVVPSVLKGVESFLDKLPTLLAYYGSEILKDKPSTALGKQFYELTKPVACYLRLVDVWTHVVRSITENLQRQDNAIDKFLCEPLARLSFGILRGLVKLLPDSDDEVLKDICLRLAVLSRYGIFYEETFDFMLTPMLEMFEQHFQLFCERSALIFVYSAFSCEMTNDAGYIQLYNFLEKMLNKFSDGQQRDAKGNLYLRLLTNELISDNYLAIQFENLKPTNSNPLLIATLKYLNTLQLHLVSTEPFTSRFLEQILLVLLSGLSTAAVGSMAAQLYVKLSRRQYDEQEIVVHVLETFLKTQHNSRRCACYKQAITLLQNFLVDLMQHFAALQNFNYYIFVLNAENVRDELVLFTAQSIYALFEVYTKQYDKQQLALQEIHKLLRNWPDLIERTAQRSAARAVLYGVYCATDFSALAQENLQLLCQLETYCLKNFLADQTLNEAEFSSLFANICKSVAATGNEDLLVMAAQTLQDEYAELSMQLLLLHDQEQTVPEELLQSYAQCVRRLYALLKENKLRAHQVCHMYDTLAMQILSPAKPLNECLAIYGFETLALMLSLLQRERDQLVEVELHEEKVSQLAKQLLEICLGQLQSVSDNLPQVKSLFCAMLVLLLDSTLYHCLTLDATIYDVLINKLSNPSLPQRTRLSTLCASYVQQMHLLFRQLHCSLRGSLPSNRIWKLLMQFKMRTKHPDYISSELEKLISVLIKRHMDTYVHCLPVIYLHICNEKISRKRIEIALSAHLQLLEEHASAKDAWLLRLQVFNAALELLIKNLSVHRTEISVNRQRNHLLPLQHLMPLLSTLRLEQHHFMNIARLLFSLKSNAFGEQDKQELDKFLTQISAHKCLCEDEHLKALTGVDMTFVLKPEPSGPCTWWQVEGFSQVVENSCDTAADSPHVVIADLNVT